MSVKIISLDWRSTDALISQQETTINTFLTTHTLLNVSAVGEFIIAIYNNSVPATPHKVKIFKAVESISANGISATETAIDNFITGKTLRGDPLWLDSGVILVIYQ